MARGVNKVILLGNVGQPPDSKFTPGGVAVTNLSIATNESWRDKQSGQMQDRTEWHRVVFFNRLAEIAGEYLQKGSKVYIEGKLQTRKWQDQQGQDRYSTEIVGSELQMLDSKGDNAGGGNNMMGRGEYGSAPKAPPQQHAAPAQHQPQPQSAPPPAMDSFDDDIPF